MAMRMAKVLSEPPDKPKITLESLICCKRLAKAWAAKFRTDSKNAG